jgi:hypothetical protein
MFNLFGTWLSAIVKEDMAGIRFGLCFALDFVELQE